MKPLPFVWPYALVFWAVEVWAFYPEFQIINRARRSRTEKDAGSLEVILMGLNVAFLASFAIAWVHSLQFRAYRNEMFVVGVALIIAGSLFRRHCFRMLGSSFTGDVRASPDQQVVTRGAYSILRHPSYTAGIIMNIGAGLALGSWASLVVVLVASVIVYGYRIHVEERALLAAIGEPYRQFTKTRKRLIPFVY